jgi:CubicO group peptidase (beta-lactamase class C family)
MQSTQDCLSIRFLPAKSHPEHGLVTMKILPIAAWVSCLVSCCLAADEPAIPRSSPESQGVSSSSLLEFVETADKTLDSLHSVMLLRHGRVVAEGWWAPYRADSPHSLYSLSKSFTSTAIGMAISEEKLSLDDPILKFFPEDSPKSPDDRLKQMRVSDLLRMSTGHRSEPPRIPSEAWVRTFLKHPVPDKPGTHFLYNTSATYMLSAIVQKATGTTLLDYLKPRLFEPLGIENPTWETSPQGISAGGFGLSIRTEDIARFGQLYLQKGLWQGKQLVPSSWVDAATRLQTSNGSDPGSDWDQGYGYQFWQCRHGAYRGDGAFGQFCIVLPEQDAVIAITSGLKNMQAVLDLVWDRLLPALNPTPLAEDAAAREKLVRKLKGLSLKPQAGSGTPSKVTGRRYRFPANDLGLESIAIESGEEADVLVARFKGNEQRITCGRGEWKKGRMAYADFPERPEAASGAWIGGDTYKVRICFYETPFIVTFTLKFSDDQLDFGAESNVGFKPTKNPRLTGTAE